VPGQLRAFPCWPDVNARLPTDDLFFPFSCAEFVCVGPTFDRHLPLEKGFLNCLVVKSLQSAPGPLIPRAVFLIPPPAALLAWIPFLHQMSILKVVGLVCFLVWALFCFSSNDQSFLLPVSPCVSLAFDLAFDRASFAVRGDFVLFSPKRSL